MNSPSDAIQADGEPLHTTCHATVRTIRANFDQALRDRDRRATADEHIGQAIRRLTQPGVKRKTIRIDELRDIVDDADRAAPTTDTRDLAIAALRDQVATLQTETIRLEHLLDQIRRLPQPGITHLCPPDGSPLTPCCARLPFELPSTDRLTLDPSQVTCRESEQPPERN